MTPAQVAHIMALVSKYGEACDNFTLGAHSAHSINARAAVEAALRDAPQQADYEAVLADHNRLVRELDVLLNGENAARQASLCDLVSQIANDGSWAEPQQPECRFCGGTGKVEQYTSATAPHVKTKCPMCAGDGVCRTAKGCAQHGCHGGCLPTPSAPTAVEPDERAEFEIELRKQCFQEPTPEAHDLAWCMWQARASKGTPL